MGSRILLNIGDLVVSGVVLAPAVWLIVTLIRSYQTDPSGKSGFWWRLAGVWFIAFVVTVVLRLFVPIRAATDLLYAVSCLGAMALPSPAMEWLDTSWGARWPTGKLRDFVGTVIWITLTLAIVLLVRGLYHAVEVPIPVFSDD